MVSAPVDLKSDKHEYEHPRQVACQCSRWSNQNWDKNWTWGTAILSRLAA